MAVTRGGKKGSERGEKKKRYRERERKKRNIGRETERKRRDIERQTDRREGETYKERNSEGMKYRRGNTEYVRTQDRDIQNKREL